MKFASFSITTLAATFLVGLTYGGFPDEDEGSLSRHQARKMENANYNGVKSKDDDDTIDLIVTYKNEAGHHTANRYDSRGKGQDISNKYHTEVITARKKDMEALAQDPNIASVEPDFEVHALPHMRGYAAAGEGGRRLEESVPYGITMVNPPIGGQQLMQGTHHIKVCVVDTGYDNEHTDLPDLDDTTDGFSPYSGETWSHDGNGHGTHCAGTIGAIGGNDNGVTSLNPDPNKFSFFIAKGLRDGGSGTGSGVLQAVEKCVDEGAKIISMSLGGGGFSTTTNDTFSGYYEEEGVLLIAAAGNDGNSAYNYPASYGSVMSVAAVDNNKVKASFSQFNDQVEIAAPGVLVESTLPNNQYAAWSGTSMATPHVAGVAALVWSHFPDCTNKQIREALIKSTEDLGVQGCDNGYGFGLVDAQAAYQYLETNGCEFSVGETVGGCNQCPECSSAPTSSPVAFPGCPDNERYFKVSITTDNYGSETSWRVTKENGQDQITGGNYASNRAHTERYCIPNDACTFEISDEYGDGMCCNYGNGSYEVWINNMSKGSGGAFGSSATVDLCDGMPTPAPVAPVTPAPTLPPTLPPTMAPTPLPTPAPVAPTILAPTLSDPCVNVQVSIGTDDYPDETEWSITDKEGTVIVSGNGYTTRNVEHIKDECVPTGRIYTFTILDTYGDGICCDYGEGSYKLSLGETAFIQGGAFGSSIHHKFAIADDETVLVDHDTCTGEAFSGATQSDIRSKIITGEKCKESSHCLSGRCSGNGICI